MSRPSSLRADAMLVLVCAAAFGPALPADLIHYDDSLYLRDNTELLSVAGWTGLAHVWDGSRAWAGQFPEFFPLRDTVYWLIFQGWGLTGFPYHLASLLFHIAASLLARRLALAMGLTRWSAAAAALLFAAHPIHIESVAWAAGLKDPMYTAFMFGTLLAWTRYRTQPSAATYTLSLALFIAALLTKSMALSTPLLMLALGRLTGSPTPWKTLAARLSSFIAVSGLFVVQFVLIGRANRIILGPHGGSWSSHAVLTLWAQAKYLKQSLVPSTFRLIYCFEPADGLTDLRLWFALLSLSVVLGLLWVWRHQPPLLLGVVWYFACLLPVSNLVPFPAVMADRYLYAAVFGVCVVLTLHLERMRHTLRTVALAVVVCGLTLTCAFRSTLWTEEENLWAEPDEDPACVLDRSIPAADTHVLRFRVTRNRRVALEAVERALASPGLQRGTHLCEMLQGGAVLTARLGEPARGEAWAHRSVDRCPDDAASWSALAAVTQHRKPALALSAAERLWELKPAPVRQALVGLMRLEVGRDDGVELVLSALRDDPSVCGLVQQWAMDVPSLTRLRDSLGACFTR